MLILVSFSVIIIVINKKGKTMQDFKKQYIFEDMPIPKAVATLAVPTILGMLVSIIYNIADTFFVGRIGDPNQVAAVTITMPIFMFLMAFGNLFGIGSMSYISRLLGSKSYSDIKKTSAFSFFSCLAIGIIIAVVGILQLDNIVHLLGSSDNTFEFARQYLRTVFLGAPFIILSFAFGQLLRAEGAAKEAMIGMMIGTVINIVLDPILILTFKMGVYGAAVATVFANFISVAYYLIYLIFNSDILSISPKDFSLDFNIIKNILKIGVPASLTNLLLSISSVILNNFAVNYGDAVVAALGIISRVLMFPVLLSIGLCQGVQPLIGYSYAADNRARLKATMKFTGFTAVISSTLISTLLFVASFQVVRVFIDDIKTIELGSLFLRINLISIPFLSILFLFSFTFQAVGKGIPSLILAISRQGFIFIPTIIIGNAFFGLNGIVFAQPIADIVSSFLSVIMALFVFKRDSKLSNLEQSENN